jgi:REP element-mobilizing transposase RayT
MSQDHNHLNHATWEYKYHVVFTPKYRKKVSEGEEFDLDCAERGTQAAQFSGPQILGEGLLRFDSGAE